MKRLIVCSALAIAGCVDAIDQSAGDCEQAMLRRIVEKTAFMPSDPVLLVKGAKVEHWLEGGEKRLKAIEARVKADWKDTDVQPVDEITFALSLTEDAVGFRERAESRTREICAFAEANRVKYQKWSIGAPGFAAHVSQTPPTDIVAEVAPE